MIVAIVTAVIAAAAVGLLMTRFGQVPPQAPSQDTPIQQLIQRANDEQVQAIATKDPSVMADSATPEHYQELLQVNQHLLGLGVTSITLDKLEWGAIAVNGTHATVTTYETWTTSASPPVLF